MDSFKIILLEFIFVALFILSICLVFFGLWELGNQFIDKNRNEATPIIIAIILGLLGFIASYYMLFCYKL